MGIRFLPKGKNLIGILCRDRIQCTLSISEWHWQTPRDMDAPKTILGATESLAFDSKLFIDGRVDIHFQLF